MAQTVVDDNESFHATAGPIVLARAGRSRHQVEVA
jgi:hypothetical protein